MTLQVLFNTQVHSVSDAVDQTVDNTQDVLDSDVADVDVLLDGTQHIVEGATDGVAGIDTQLLCAFPSLLGSTNLLLVVVGSLELAC